MSPNIIRVDSFPSKRPFLWAWYDFADTATITLDGSGKISQILDKSGQHHDATQASAAHRPGETTINGLNAGLFTGDHTHATILQSAPIHLDPPITWFCVGTLDNDPLFPNNPKWFEANDSLGSSTTFELFYQHIGGFPFTFFQVDADAMNNPIGGPFTQQLFTGRTNPANRFALNGTQFGGGILGDGGMGQIALGGENSPDVDGLTGAVCELIVYAGDLAAGPLTAIEAGLRAKWGTP